MNIKTFEGGYDKNLSYLIWCSKTRLATLIDPSVEPLPILALPQITDIAKIITSSLIIELWPMFTRLPIHTFFPIYVSSCK